MTGYGSTGEFRIVKDINTIFTPDDYNTWLPLPRPRPRPINNISGELAFSVKAANDAHIALGSVEIVIGGSGNTFSCIRPATGDVDPHCEMVSGAYLSGSEFKTFRISWSQTDIKLEHLSLCKRWVTVTSIDRPSFDPMRVEPRVMTGYGSTGVFQLIRGWFQDGICEIGTVKTPNDFRKWFPFASTLEYKDVLVFSVKASNDAHIALGSAKAKDEPTGRNIPNHVEIFIGEGDNSSSGIRSATNDVTNQVEVRGAYLSGSDFKTFRISWSSTEIKLERFWRRRWFTVASMD